MRYLIGIDEAGRGAPPGPGGGGGGRAFWGWEAEPKDCRVLLDGSLRAPAEYIRQETIIRGDDTEPVISLASIMAKVTRDRLMKQISSKYPEYDFHVHKGYGTLAHRRIIATSGLCDLHRRTFCTRLLP